MTKEKTQAQINEEKRLATLVYNARRKKLIEGILEETHIISSIDEIIHDKFKAYAVGHLDEQNIFTKNLAQDLYYNRVGYRDHDSNLAGSQEYVLVQKTVRDGDISAAIYLVKKSKEANNA